MNSLTPRHATRVFLQVKILTIMEKWQLKRIKARVIMAAIVIYLVPEPRPYEETPEDTSVVGAAVP